MTLTAICWACSGLALQTPQYTLSLERKGFQISNGNSVTHVPWLEKVKPGPKFLAFRNDATFAVWDSRGLTVRHDDQTASYRFSGFPIDPRFFSEQEIDQTRQAVQQGSRKLEANGLAGGRRIGERAFFLVKWSDSTGKPWLEALAEIDLNASHPTPKVLGRFSGLTNSTLPIDNLLFVNHGGLGAITRRINDWGLASYSLATGSFDYVSLGEQLSSWTPPNLFVEQTPYGSKIGGRFRFSDDGIEALFEDRGSADWLDGDTPPIATINDSRQLILRNCSTGEELKLSPDAMTRRTPFGVLAWSPAKSPSYAVLLDPSNWNRLASWKR